MTTLVDTHITPLLFPAWGTGTPCLEASATWLPDEKPSDNQIAAALLSLPPLYTPLQTNFLTSFRVNVNRNLENVCKAVCKANVTVNADSIIININAAASPKCITLDTNVYKTVYDVLNALQDNSTWNICNLVLSPPSNIASPLAASDDPNVTYDWTPKFLEPGDWVDMGDRRIECDDDDIIIISLKNGSRGIMKLNPSAIHGGYFEICIN